MLIYLAHAKANYSSEKDGYVMGMRTAEHPRTLWSFHFSRGSQKLPMNDEDILGLQHVEELDEHGLRPQPPGG